MRGYWKGHSLCLCVSSKKLSDRAHSVIFYLLNGMYELFLYENDSYQLNYYHVNFSDVYVNINICHD